MPLPPDDGPPSPVEPQHLPIQTPAELQPPPGPDPLPVDLPTNVPIPLNYVPDDTP